MNAGFYNIYLTWSHLPNYARTCKISLYSAYKLNQPPSLLSNAWRCHCQLWKNWHVYKGCWRKAIVISVRALGGRISDLPVQVWHDLNTDKAWGMAMYVYIPTHLHVHVRGMALVWLKGLIALIEQKHGGRWWRKEHRPVMFSQCSQ